MEEIVEIILSAVDEASSIFSSVSDSAEEMGSALESNTSEGSTGFEELEESAQEATGTIQDVIDHCQNVDGSSVSQTAGSFDDLEQEAMEADQAVQSLSDDLGIINSSMMLQTAEQIGAIGDKAENMAQEMNTAAISVGQLATQTGIAEPQMVSLINNISNATFPNEEAMMYVKSLDQMGVSSENLGQSATNIDRINDAFGLGAQTTNSLAQELGVLGVDMNNVSSSFNALAYANANTVGGMQNYYLFLRKYDAQFKELGFDVDQSSIIIAAATQKYGGGKAALSGLSSALKEADGDTRKLEQALGLQAGTLDHASEVTGEYEGQLEQLAGEEAEHKTILDQIGAAWEDFSLALSGVLSPLSSVMGLVGQAGSFAMQINGLVTLGSTMKGIIGTIREMNIVQTLSNILKGEAVVADTAAAGAVAAEGVAAAGASGGFWAMAAAELAALWPVLAIIAAIALFVAAVYEVGKAFGWWTDIGSMLDAIWAGINRLWDAFINHPDVQAALQAISDALAWIWDGLQQAGQAVLEFLGVSTSGDFDIVAAIIQSIGQAWDIITAPIRFVIGLFIQAGEAGAAVGDAIGDMWNNTMGPFGEWLSSVFGPIWDAFGQAFENIKPYVDDLTKAFDDFKNGQLDIPGLVSAVVMAAWNAWTTFVGTMSGALLEFAGNLWNGAYTAGANFLSGIVTWFSQIPGRVWSYLSRTSTNIGNNLHQWVVTARNRAMAFVTGIITRLSQLPGRVASALASVVGTIRTAIQNWINTAKSKVTDLINDITKPFSNVGSTISSNLSDVTSAITKPFSKAYDDLVGIVDKIKNKASEVSGFAFGGETAYGGETSTASYSVDNSPIEVNQNLTLDFKNVPSHLDTNQLINALTEPSVLQALTGNSDFQAMDGRVKQRLQLKMNRSRGI